MQSHDDRAGDPASDARGTYSASDSPNDARLREQLGEAAEDAKTKARDQGEHYRDVAADKVDAAADSARAAADQLDDDALSGELSRHIGDLADGMSRFSTSLREKSADEMVRDLRHTARDHPALFLAGSVALGFGISRFAQASSRSAAPGARTDAAGNQNHASSSASQPAGRRSDESHADVDGSEGALRQDEGDSVGSGPPLTSSPDARRAAQDAAAQHPRPPYGAPSTQEDRHE